MINQSLIKKNILITGASGFIGSFLVEEAIKRNYNTFAGIRTTSSRKYLSNPDIYFLELNFNDENSLDSTLKKFADSFGRFDFIIHAAGIVKAINKKDFAIVNFEGTKNFVEALKRNKLVPDKFIYISSLASFGPATDISPITAATIQKPITAYGKSKLEAEKYLYSNPDFPFLIINPAAVYGPRDKEFFFLLKTIQKHLEFYIDSDKQLLSFIHVQDLAEAIFLSMESSCVNQNLLISDLNNYTSKTFNNIIKRNLSKKTVSFIVPSIVANFISIFSELIAHLKEKPATLNRERLKEFKAKNWSVGCPEIVRLGFSPRFNLEDGLANTIDWYKENGWLGK